MKYRITSLRYYFTGYDVHLLDHFIKISIFITNVGVTAIGVAAMRHEDESHSLESIIYPILSLIFYPFHAVFMPLTTHGQLIQVYPPRKP